MKMNVYLGYPIQHLMPNLKTIVNLVHGFVSGENSRVQPVVVELVEGHAAPAVPFVPLCGTPFLSS